MAAAAFPGERPLYLVSRASLRARLGRNTELIVLCRRHQSTISLQALARRRVPGLAAQVA